MCLHDDVNLKVSKEGTSSGIHTEHSGLPPAGCSHVGYTRQWLPLETPTGCMVSVSAPNSMLRFAMIGFLPSYMCVFMEAVAGTRR